MDKYWSDKPKFLNWNREDYIKNNVLYTVPMTAGHPVEHQRRARLPPLPGPRMAADGYGQGRKRLFQGPYAPDA